MCHAVRVRLTPEERAYAKRITGYLIPVYAAAVLAIIALAAVTGGPRSDALIASASAPAAAPRSTGDAAPIGKEIPGRKPIASLKARSF